MCVFVASAVQIHKAFVSRDSLLGPDASVTAQSLMDSAEKRVSQASLSDEK